MLQAPKQKSTYEAIPAGSYVARLFSLIHIGTQSFEYKGEKKTANKVRLTFELPTEMKEFKEGEGKKPYIISQEFTLSMHPKSKLRPTIEAWLGTKLGDEEAYSFNLEDLIGKECLLSVIHTEKEGNTYANISTISPLPKGMECSEQINKTINLNYTNFDDEVFNALPNFLKDKMMATPEYAGIFEARKKDIKIDEKTDKEIDKALDKAPENKKDVRNVETDTKHGKAMKEAIDEAELNAVINDKPPVEE